MPWSRQTTIKGPKGATGGRGAVGPPGAMGSTGGKGQRGLPGRVGHIGLDGPAGPQGGISYSQGDGKYVRMTPAYIPTYKSSSVVNGLAVSGTVTPGAAASQTYFDGHRGDGFLIHSKGLGRGRPDGVYQFYKSGFIFSGAPRDTGGRDIGSTANYWRTVFYTGRCTTLSDPSMKKNIKDHHIDPFVAIDNARAKKFRWNDHPELGEQLGHLASDHPAPIQHEADDGSLWISSHHRLYFLWEAMHQLDVRATALGAS